MKVIITLTVIDAFGTVTKGQLKGLEDLKVGWLVGFLGFMAYQPLLII